MIQPRKVIDRMAPYRPPIADRKGKVRLDFNERTDGRAESVLAALGGMSAEDLQAYPDSTAAVTAAAEYYGVPRDRIAMTNGTDEAIRALFSAYVDPGDPVVIPVPTFAMYGVTAEIAAAQIVTVPSGPDMAFSVDAIAQAVPNPRMVVIASPNNPTGTELSADQLRQLLTTLPDSLIVLDEAYAEFTGESFIPWTEQHDNLIVLRTLSKAWGVAGLRAGFLIGPPDAVAVIHKVLPPYGVNSAAAVAAIACFQNLDYLDAYVGEVNRVRPILLTGLDRLGIVHFPSRANFVLTVLGPDSKAAVTALAQQEILIRPRTEVTTHAGCVRITLGTEEQVGQLLEALREWKEST